MLSADNLKICKQFKDKKRSNFETSTDRNKSMKNYFACRVYPYKHSILFVGHRHINSAGPDQMPRNVASDQALHSVCLQIIQSKFE